MCKSCLDEMGLHTYCLGADQVAGLVHINTTRPPGIMHHNCISSRQGDFPGEGFPLCETDASDEVHGAGGPETVAAYACQMESLVSVVVVDSDAAAADEELMMLNGSGERAGVQQRLLCGAGQHEIGLLLRQEFDGLSQGAAAKLPSGAYVYVSACILLAV
jgi:hypothetical protein